MVYSRDASGGAGLSVGAGASLIDRASHFDGVFRTGGDLLIEGEFEGEIHCEGTVTIAETARVSGSLQTGTLSVAGVLQGEVDCAGRFEILASGQVSAQVVSGSVTVRDGAYYEGEMRMRSEPPGLATRETTTTHGSSPGLPAVAQQEAPTDQAEPRATRNGRETAVARPAASES